MRLSHSLPILALMLTGCSGEILAGDADAAPPSPSAPDQADAAGVPAETQPNACNGALVTVADKSGIASAGSGPVCPRLEQSTFAWKSGAAGEPCAGPLDCAPVCCACASPERSALTSWCFDGVCATTDQVCCALAGTPTLSCGTP